MITRLLDKLPPKTVIPALTFAIGAMGSMLWANWRSADKALASTVVALEERMQTEEKATSTSTQAYTDVLRRLGAMDRQMDRMEEKLDLLLERGRKK